MDFNYFFNIAALLILVCLGINMIIKNNMKSTLYNMMLGMLTLLLLSIAADTCSLYFTKIYNNMNQYMVKVYLYTYYASHLVFAMVTSWYVILAIKKGKYKGRVILLSALMAIAAAVVLVINVFNGFVFKVSSDLEVTNGNGTRFMYVANVGLIIMAFIYAQYYSRKMSKREMMTIYTVIVIPIVCGAVQLFLPELMIENFGYALILVAIAIGIKNMEEVVDYTSQVLDKQAFYSCIRQKISKKNTKEYQVVMIYLKNLYEYLEMIGMKYEDNLLKKCASYLKHTFPKAKIYYLGEESFAMIFTQGKSKFEDGDIVAVKNRFAMPWLIGNYSITLEAIMLILNIEPGELSFDDIIEYIDYAETKAKESAKEIYYKNDLDINEIRRVYNIMQLLKYAVNNDGFEVVYQPIYSAKDKNIVSAEALVRLKDDKTLGYISPEEFIPVAEKGGLILDIGETVLRNVCRFISNYKEELMGTGVKYIEVNLSTIQCMEHDIDKKSKDIMQEYNVEPTWFNFEVTETAEINSLEYVRKNINELKKSAISFSLDDYGSGNANINYLLELPFEIVKIDKIILWNAFHNETQMEALESTVSMLHELGIKIVVEGIEKKQYLDKMLSLKCEYFQGYLFGKPMQEEKYIDYCRTKPYLNEHIV